MSDSSTTWRLIDHPPAGIDAEGGDGDAIETRTVVVDPAWTSDRGARSGPSPVTDPIPIRPIARRVLAGHDPHGEALALADQLGGQAGLDEALTVGDVTLWPRRRLVAWRRLHDLILWRAIVGELGIRPGETVSGDPPDALRDILGLMAPKRPVADASSTVRSSTSPAPSLARRLLRRGRAVVRPPLAAPTPPAGPYAADRQRLDRWFSGDRRPLLVLTDSAVHQVVDTPDGPRRLDPFLGPIVQALRGARVDPILVDLANAPGAATDDRSVPVRAITSVADDPTARAEAEAAAAAASARLETARASVDLDGIDVGPLLLDAERSFAGDGIGPWLLARARIEAFLAGHRPAGILLVNEYGRPEWLSAARRQGIPVAAVQHGLIHRRHAGYVLPGRTPALVLADRTYVFGPFEQRLLTGGVYHDDEVRIGGSPRLDLLARRDADRTADDAAADRRGLRTRLGARAGERLVVFSSTNNADIRRLVVAPALEGILDRPLPGVRLVVKLHPAEAPHDLYERLAAGLAAAGGFDPPPISVIRDVDLFTLLGAAEAHLGIHSTVLSDAVVAGVRNLVVVGFPGSDLLDYVDRGVARPVRDGGDLLASLDEPPPAPDDAARTAFLADQFRRGDAGARIAADLLEWLGA